MIAVLDHDRWEVYQRMIVVKNDWTWEREDYDALVWKCDRDNQITISPVPVQEGYARGLLRVKVNGERATMSQFTEKLATLNLTPMQVFIAINQ